MRRRTIISLFVLIMILTIPNMGYAANARRNINNYQVNIPSDPATSTKEKVTLVSGNAPNGTEIVIEVYGTTDLTGKKFNLNKLPNDTDYILISSETIKSGRLGFAKEVELVNGINKVVVIFKVNGVPQEQRIIYVYDKALAEEAVKTLNLLTK